MEKIKEFYPYFKEVGITEKGNRIFIDTQYNEVAIEIEGTHLEQIEGMKVCPKCGTVLSIKFDEEEEKIVSPWDWPRRAPYKEWYYKEKKHA